jgi:F-type H+-transporting ATPase subunit epsilon
MNCIVVTPETTALDEKADFVAVPLFDGEIGIAVGHSPMIGRLGYGELRIKSGSSVSRYYVDGGFVQVSNDVVSVLTNRAIPASEVDAEAAQSQLEEARTRPANTPELRKIRDRLESQARGQLRVARSK